MKVSSALDLSAVRAKDVMRTEINTLSASDTIESALATFEDMRISGAPVVDSGGKLVGVLTLSDVTRTEHLSSDRVHTDRGPFAMSEVTGDELTDETDPNEVFLMKEDYSSELVGRDLVGDWMARDVVVVDPDRPLLEVCAMMVKHHIHRVFVTQGEKLVGLVSSFDVVRYIAQGTARAGKKSR